MYKLIALIFLLISSFIDTTKADVLSDQIIQTEIVEELAIVSRVVDGDTIELMSGEKVRYIGIDTPETKHPIKGVECYGKEASEINKKLVEGKEVRLEKDVSDTDRYGRLLRYVYVDDIFVNDYLVNEGYAKSSSYPPDIKHQEEFILAEAYSRENKLGLWGDICDVKEIPIVVHTPKPTPLPIYITTPKSLVSVYTCNCSKTCSNMISCEEAYFQLNTCDCSRRDGDSDGIPCESICR